MSLIVSYLVVSKVYLSLDRYMSARAATGQAFLALREMNQLQLVYTQSQLMRNKNDETDVRAWRRATLDHLTKLLHCVVESLQEERKASWLARNEGNPSGETSEIEDPLLYVQVLREHLYLCPGLPEELHMLERSRLQDVLRLFSEQFAEVLKFASTPLPLALVQLGRTFLFLYTFTLPLALLGLLHERNSMFSVELFVFFLTYGFVGLEFVSMKLLHPFGGDPHNDMGLKGLAEATIRGMRADVNASCGKLPKGYRQPKRLGNQIPEYLDDSMPSLAKGAVMDDYHSMA